MNDKNASRGCEKGQLRVLFLAVGEHVTCWEKLKGFLEEMTGVSLVRSKEESLVRAAIRSRGELSGASKAFITSKAESQPWGRVESRSKVVTQGLAKEFTCCHTDKKKPPGFPLVVWHDLILIFESVPRQQWWEWEGKGLHFHCSCSNIMWLPLSCNLHYGTELSVLFGIYF